MKYCKVKFVKKDLHQHNDSMYFGAPSSSFSKAVQLRKNMTPAEKVLWEVLKGKRLDNLKFRRQHPIHLYIVDFYCHQLKLVVEIDGKYHNIKKQQEKDKLRTKDLEYLGLHVIRFTNQEVLNDLTTVLRKIKEYNI